MISGFEIDLNFMAIVILVFVHRNEIKHLWRSHNELREDINKIRSEK